MLVLIGTTGHFLAAYWGSQGPTAPSRPIEPPSQPGWPAWRSRPSTAPPCLGAWAARSPRALPQPPTTRPARSWATGEAGAPSSLGTSTSPTRSHGLPLHRRAGRGQPRANLVPPAGGLGRQRAGRERRGRSTSPRSAHVARLLVEGRHLRGFGALVAPLGVLRRPRPGRRLEELQLARPPRRPPPPGARGPGRRRQERRPQRRGRRGRPEGVGWRRPTRRRSGRGTGARVQRISPLAHRVPQGRPGWVTVGTTYQDGWFLRGKAAVPTAEGTVMSPAGRPAPWCASGLGASPSSAVASRRGPSSWWRRPSPGTAGRRGRRSRGFRPALSPQASGPPGLFLPR